MISVKCAERVPAYLSPVLQHAQDLHLIGSQGQSVGVNKLLFMALSTYAGDLQSADLENEPMFVTVEADVDALLNVARFLRQGLLPLDCGQQTYDTFKALGIPLEGRNLIKVEEALLASENVVVKCDPDESAAHTQPQVVDVYDEFKLEEEELGLVEDLADFEEADDDDDGDDDDDDDDDDDEDDDDDDDDFVAPKKRTSKKRKMSTAATLSKAKARVKKDPDIKSPEELERLKQSAELKPDLSNLKEYIKAIGLTNRAGGTCPVCHKNFSKLRKHLEQIHNPEDFPCPQCEKIFHSKNSLKHHLTYSHVDGGAETICSECGVSVHSKYTLESHMKKYHSPTSDPSLQPKAPKRIGYTLGKMKIVKGELQRVTCEFCQREFTGRGAYYRHRSHILSIHTDDSKKPYSCEVCKKGFPSLHKLKLHQPVHDKTKTHLCSICGARFRHSSNRDQHEKKDHLHQGMVKMKKKKRVGAQPEAKKILPQPQQQPQQPAQVPQAPQPLQAQPQHAQELLLENSMNLIQQ